MKASRTHSGSTRAEHSVPERISNGGPFDEDQRKVVTQAGQVAISGEQGWMQLPPRDRFELRNQRDITREILRMEARMIAPAIIGRHVVDSLDRRGQ